MALATGTMALIAAGASLAGGAMQANAAKKAAKSQANAAHSAIGEQQAAREQFQQNIQPYLDVGQGALPQLQQLNSGDYSAFMNSPDYQFTRDQGLQSLERGAAARGGFMGGGADADRMQFASGLGAQQLGAYRGNLMDTIRLGQNSAVSAGSMGQQSANNIGNLMGNIGNAQAGSAINQSNAWSNALAGLGSAAGQYAAARQSSYQPSGNLWAMQTQAGPGSPYNFGNNVSGFAGRWGV